MTSTRRVTWPVRSQQDIALIPSVHGLTYTEKYFQNNPSFLHKLLESGTAHKSWDQSISQLNSDSVSGQGWIAQHPTAHQHCPQTFVSMGRRPWHNGQKDRMPCASYNKLKDLDSVAFYGYGVHPAVRSQLCTSSKITLYGMYGESTLHCHAWLCSGIEKQRWLRPEYWS